MRTNLPVTQREYDYPADWILLSTTDTQSHITYANPSFCTVAGYELDAMLGKPHNMVRHPDMPPQAFEDLWRCIKKGEPWKGIVKNRCANGDHYWVDAYVSPISVNGKVVEFQSVRTKPTREQVKRAETAYAELNKNGSVSALKRTVSMPTKLLLLALLAMLPMLYLALQIGLMGFIALAISILVLLVGGNLVLSRYYAIVAKAKHIYDNPLMAHIYSGNSDDLGAIDLALQMQNSELKSILGRASDSCNNVSEQAKISAAKGKQIQSTSQAQLSEIEQVATAMQEMTATLGDMSSNCADAASASQMASAETINGDKTVSSTISSIQAMAEQLQQTSKVITELEAHSKDIGTVLDVIQSIAGQTNLLALNAAIEAARAGEQGRGFAVVADEVRALAQRTHDATKEIQSMINLLQQETNKAVVSMQQGVVAAADCISTADLAGAALRTIREAISTITDMTHHIASAVEEQSSVANEMNRSVVNVSQFTHSSHQLGSEMVGLNDEVTREMDSHSVLVDQFLKRSFRV
ncbi:methyl-accepting chemotaxis protein [Shewanella sp. SP2S2-6]|uniref:methyl-accepting chemotaxis protein n=1 Tax=Shewanella sp. SP2S2-6 TaxID=3063540 RepID=UPI0028910B3E|nr:methyl-accepting chemotaxis protein [Shewanella sp. SP2S2-6]MDT3294662.1 methyl-accepting chemotaxis protein [Shewanella sp. SP2S2-6]